MSSRWNKAKNFVIDCPRLVHLLLRLLISFFFVFFFLSFFSVFSFLSSSGSSFFFLSSSSSFFFLSSSSSFFFLSSSSFCFFLSSPFLFVCLVHLSTSHLDRSNAPAWCIYLLLLPRPLLLFFFSLVLFFFSSSPSSSSSSSSSSALSTALAPPSIWISLSLNDGRLRGTKDVCSCCAWECGWLVRGRAEVGQHSPAWTPAATSGPAAASRALPRASF